MNGGIEMYYYELVYFYNRKNSGSIYVNTDKSIKDFIGEDEFLDYIIGEGKITYQEAQQVTEVNDITKDEYDNFNY